MRAIDADALQKEYMHEHDGKRLMLIDVAPTIEPRCETCEAFNKTRLLIPQPERTGRKTGKWINIRNDNVAECDQCGITGRAWMNFCFDCGADMRAERRTDEQDSE